MADKFSYGADGDALTGTNAIIGGGLDWKCNVIVIIKAFRVV